jgi:hypothetical protein
VVTVIFLNKALNSRLPHFHRSVINPLGNPARAAVQSRE